MTAFDAHQLHDKGLGFPQDDDHQQSLFDQSLNHDSSDFLLDCTKFEGRDEFDFDFDFNEDSTTGESRSVDSSTSSKPSIKQTHPQIVSSTFERSSALRPHRALPRSQHLTSSISASELLNIEGKSQLISKVIPQPSGYRSLSRKSRSTISQTYEQQRSNRISKNSSSEKMRSAYDAHQDWTQRFEQMSVQQPDTFRSDLSSPIPEDASAGAVNSPVYSPYGQQASNVNHRKTTSEQVARPRLQNYPNSSDSQSRTRSYFPVMPQQSPSRTSPVNGFIPSEAQRNSSQTNDLPQPWNQTQYMHQESTISPTQLQNWNSTVHHNETSYFTNTTPHPDNDIPEFNSPDWSYNPYATQSYSLHHGLPSSNQDDFPISPYTTTSPPLLETMSSWPAPPPTPSTPNTTPITPQESEPVTPTSRSTRSSTTTTRRRRPTAPTLRLPKSAGSLRHPNRARSGDLRSPKSASAIGRSKSSGTLKHNSSHPSHSHTNNASSATSPHKNSAGGGGGFEFKNFTLADAPILVTSVAPSGSSKTKDRREKEAKERERAREEQAERERRSSLAAQKKLLQMVQEGRFEEGEAERLRRMVEEGGLGEGEGDG